MNGRGPEDALPPGLPLRVAGTPPAPSQQTEQRGSHPVIADHELLKKIGGGSFGAVWLARNVLGTYRAVKVVYRHTFGDTAHFEREYKGLQKCEPISRSHEGLVDILQIGRDDQAGYFYYVMELADDATTERSKTERSNGVMEYWSNAKRPGALQPAPDLTPSSPPLQHSNTPTLHHSNTPTPQHTNTPSLQHPNTPSLHHSITPLLQDPNAYVPRTLRADLKARGRLPLDECIQLGLSLSSALEHLHQHGLVHRDIKPLNIIFVGGVPKLADIGLVTAIDEAHSMVGTVGYIPPEGPGTPQADLYSVGKVLYEVCLGKDRQEFPQLPPDLESHREYRGLLELNDIILRACATAPHDRYQSAQEMFADLALLKGGKSVRRLRMIERRLVITTRIGLVTAGLLVVAAVAYLFAVSQTRQTEKERAKTEQLLYAADMNVAQQALEAGNLVRASALLESHRPKPGREDLRGFEWYYLKNLCRGDETYTFHGHTQPVECVAVSPDGKLLASCGDDETIRIWDLSSKTNLTTLKGHRGAVNALAFSWDGTKLASGGEDKAVMLWDVASWEVAATLTNHADAVTCLAFTPDGKRLAVGTDGASVKLWDVKTAQELKEFGVAADLASLAVSPDGQYLAIGGTDFRVGLWDLSTFQRSLPDLYAGAGGMWSLAFSPDGRLLVTARSDGVFLWDLARRSLIGRLKGHEAEVHCVRFSPDGRTIASGSGDNTIRIWDVASGRQLRILKGHRDRVWSIAYSPDGQTLISGSWDHEVKLWELSPKENPTVLRGHADSVRCVAFSPDDRMLASASVDGTIKLWDPDHATNVGTLKGHAGGATGVAFSRDGLTLVSCGLDQTIRLWDSASGSALAAFPAGRKLSCLALSPDGRTLATGSGWWSDLSPSDEVCFWDLGTRKLIGHVGVHQMVQTLGFSPDGRTLAAGLVDRTVVLLDVALHRSAFVSTNFNAGQAWWPRGNTLFTEDSDNIVAFDVATHQVSARLQLPSTAIRYMAMSPDGKTLAVFYSSTKIKLCNVTTGREVATLEGHESFGMHLVFSHDGHTLASAGTDGTVRLWRAPRN